MQVQQVRLSAMFSWIIQAFQLLRKAPLCFAKASLISLSILLSFAILIGIAGASFLDPLLISQEANKLIGLYALILGVLLTAFPPLIGGWFRFCQTIDQTGTASIDVLMHTYTHKKSWRRSILFSCLSLLISAAVISMLMLIFGAPFKEFIQFLLSNPGQAHAPLPQDFWLIYSISMVLSSILQLAFMLGFAELSLTDTPSIQALQRGFSATFKNLLLLALFSIILLCSIVLIAVFFGFILAVLLVLVNTIHPGLALFFGLFLYVVLLLFAYPLLFAGHYFAWKDILSEQQNSPIKHDAIAL